MVIIDPELKSFRFATVQPHLVLVKPSSRLTVSAWVSPSSTLACFYCKDSVINSKPILEII